MQSVLTQWDHIHALAKKAFLAVAPTVLVSVNDIVYWLLRRHHLCIVYLESRILSITAKRTIAMATVNLVQEPIRLDLIKGVIF